MHIPVHANLVLLILLFSVSPTSRELVSGCMVAWKTRALLISLVIRVRHPRDTHTETTCMSWVVESVHNCALFLLITVTLRVYSSTLEAERTDVTAWRCAL